MLESVLRPILILAVIVAVLFGISWLMRAQRDHRSGEADPRRNVDRPITFMDNVAGKHAVNVMDRAKATTDLMNTKSSYAYYVNQYLLDNNGAMPQSMDDLLRAGMDPKFLKDSSGLDVHYELVDGGKRAKIYTYGPDYTGGTDDDVVIYVP